VKGVTFCGTSAASSLTMGNVPYHEEVLKFCHKMSELLNHEYIVACEHAHSCCVLIAHRKFFVSFFIYLFYFYCFQQILLILFVFFFSFSN